jgi:hypothetical protein
MQLVPYDEKRSVAPKSKSKREEDKVNVIVYFKNIQDIIEEWEEAKINVEHKSYAKCISCISSGMLDVKLAFRDLKEPVDVNGHHPFKVIHVSRQGVRIELLTKWVHKKREWHTFELSLAPKQYEALFKFAEVQLKAKYNLKGAIWNWLGCHCLCSSGTSNEEIKPHRHMHHPRGFKAKPYNVIRNWFAAELVAALLIHAGVIPYDRLAPDVSTPWKIYQQLEHVYHEMTEP